jgi:hypothetical protein
MAPPAEQRGLSAFGEGGQFLRPQSSPFLAFSANVLFLDLFRMKKSTSPAHPPEFLFRKDIFFGTFEQKPG